MQLGATDEFPSGKLNADEQGEINVSVVAVKSTGRLLIDFGRSVKWLSMSPHQAKTFAELIISQANELADADGAALDWEKALAHFRRVRQTYQDLAAAPGVNTRLALETVFRPLSERYHRGERTNRLYAAMWAVE